MSLSPPDLDRLRDLMQRHCFQYGDFTLRSGRKSTYYYNGKRVTLRPSAAKLIGEALGCRVVLVAVLVERHEGGGDALRAKGYDVLSLFRTDEEGRLSITGEFQARLQAAQVV